MYIYIYIYIYIYTYIYTYIYVYTCITVNMAVEIYEPISDILSSPDRLGLGFVCSFLFTSRYWVKQIHTYASRAAARTEEVLS
jgi:hypothetical protein